MGRATAQQKLASRIDVAADAVAGDLSAIADARTRASLLRESVILTRRFSLAATMADRRDYAIKDAQQAVMELEAIPRYDHLFIIMLENKATSSIVGSPFAPKINAYLKNGNQFTSYFATGNPSEPNRVAVAAGDDFGITDDAPWTACRRAIRRTCPKIRCPRECRRAPIRRITTSSTSRISSPRCRRQG
jgi:hypothetical protein